MAGSNGFEWLSGVLERESNLNRLEARGTIRLALKEAGLEPKSVTREQLRVVIERLLPKELVGRGMEDAAGFCRQLASRVGEVEEDAESADTPEAVFDRLGG